MFTGGCVGECWFEVNTDGVLFTCPRAPPLTRKELDTEHSGSHPAAFACKCVWTCVFMSISKKLPYMCVFIRLLNEPVWVCSLNFLALAEELLLSISVYISPPSSFVCFAVQCFLCVFTSAILRGSYLQVYWVTEHRANPPPTRFHPLFVGLEAQPIWFSWRREGAFILVGLGFTITFLLGRQSRLGRTLTMREKKLK